MASKLNERKVRTAGPGVYGDQFGLRLRVLASGARTWVWRGTVNGKRVDYGLGGWPVVTLTEARDVALEMKRAAFRGDDPRAVRGRRGVPTFGECAEKVIVMREPGWKDSGRTADQWRSSLKDYAGALAPMPVDKVTAADILAVLNPVWHRRPETANRVRVRISTILRWAVAQGLRSDDPSEAIKAALPKNGNGGEKRHHAAVAHADVADVLRAVHGKNTGHGGGRAWRSSSPRSRRPGAGRRGRLDGRRLISTRRSGRCRASARRWARITGRPCRRQPWRCSMRLASSARAAT